MAPVLLCPECGTKHPLENVGDRSAFPCSGCGRTLKVPAAAAVARSATPSAAPLDLPPVGPDPYATRPLSTPLPPLARPPVVAAPTTTPTPTPSVPGAVRPPLGDPTDDLVPPPAVRFALWIVAVPLAFFLVFGLARAVGLLSTNDVTDLALAEGWHRFLPIARLLPFVALATAGLVHGGVYGIARWRARGRTSAATTGDDAIEPSRRGAQASRSRS